MTRRNLKLRFRVGPTKRSWAGPQRRAEPCRLDASVLCRARSAMTRLWLGLQHRRRVAGARPSGRPARQDRSVTQPEARSGAGPQGTSSEVSKSRTRSSPRSRRRRRGDSAAAAAAYRARLGRLPSPAPWRGSHGRHGRGHGGRSRSHLATVTVTVTDRDSTRVDAESRSESRRRRGPA